VADPTCPPDPVEAIPDPDTVRLMLAESVRRTDLLRSLLRVSRRKAAYGPRPTEQPEGEGVSHAV
jgi:hypothetical protein